MNSVKLEIGMLYKKMGMPQLYLAVDTDAFLTIRKGKLTKFRPRSNFFYQVRNLSIDDLCKQWNISTKALDEISAKFLAPNPESRMKPSRKGRISADEEANKMKALRLAKVVA